MDPYHGVILCGALGVCAAALILRARCHAHANAGEGGASGGETSQGDAPLRTLDRSNVWLEDTGEKGGVSISVYSGDQNQGSAIAWRDNSSYGALIGSVCQGDGWMGDILAARGKESLLNLLWKEWFERVETARLGLQGQRRQGMDYLRQASRTAQKEAFSSLEKDLSCRDSWQTSGSSLSCVSVTLATGMLTIARAGNCDCLLGMRNWQGAVRAHTVTVGLPAAFARSSIVTPDTRVVEVREELRVLVLAPSMVFRLLGREATIQAALDSRRRMSPADRVVRAVKNKMRELPDKVYGLDGGFAVLVVMPWE